jgi:hypothetical protein
VASLLVDSRPGQAGAQQPAGDPTGAPDGPGGSAGSPAPEQRDCAKCGSPLAPNQDWCLQCGTGVPGSLRGGTPTWRSTTAVLAATALLVLGAGAAAIAALNKGGAKARTLTTTVAQSTPAPAVTTTTPTAPAKPGTPGGKAAGSLGAVKPPKIPLTAVTPTPSATPKIPTTAPAAAPTTSRTTTQPSSSGSANTKQGEGSRAGEPQSGESQAESQQAPILLDTNAASTYNPYNLPAAGFGDPSLAIDGDPTTGWTAQVNPATAPKMAEGLLIDLKSPQRLTAAVLSTSTPGMTIQLYGANTQTAPTSITAPAWIPLSGSTVDKKKTLRIKLRHSAKAFKFLTLWISQAPAGSVGTEQAPGHVTVDELELFPA